MSKIHLKLMNIQQSLICLKGKYSEFGKYNYRKAEDILSTAKPFLKENSCILLLSDEIELVGDRFYIKATATLMCTETGEEIYTQSFAREELSKPKFDASQVTGSASSYARKYALSGLLGLDDNKDADDLPPPTQTTPQNTQNKPKNNQASNRADNSQISEFDAKLEELKLSETEVCNYLKFKKENMTVENFNSAMKMFQTVENKRKVSANE